MAASYKKTRPKTLFYIPEIVTIHYYELDKSFVFDGEAHDFWEMVYVDKGAVEIRADDKTLVLNQGEILFHKPHEFHAIRAFRSNPDFFVISFVCRSPAMKLFEGYRAALSQSLRPFVSSIISEARNSFHIPKNDVTLLKLRRRSRAKVGGEQLIKTYLEQLLILLARAVLEQQENSVSPVRESMETQLVSTIKSYIRDNLGKKLTMEELAGVTGYSTSYISRVFRQQCGTTIGRYITAKKISYAKELIRNHTYNFAQISDMLAFDTPQYFASTFKKETDMTPSEFKRSLDIK
ncbi:MAG: helix-turn-helix transcriptional regulator [Oscillospiraceae bacterium]|nr:helix-turn-helix transcriptional regulator [Oscillospiraceae bacterium]